MTNNKNYKKRVFNHLGHVALAVLTTSLMISPSLAVEPAEAANQVVGSKGGREATKRAIDGALKLAKSKPAMSTATGIVCLACIPTVGAAASPGLCVACGILIAKTFG